MSESGPRVMPFSLEAVRALCPARTMPPEMCPVCSRIPGRVERFEKHGDVVRDDLPPEVGQLQPFLAFGARLSVDRIERCPLCNGLFEVHSEYTYLVNGSEDELSYAPVDVDAVLKLARWVSGRLERPAELRFDGDRWTIVEQERGGTA